MRNQNEEIEIGTPWPTEQDDETLKIIFEWEAGDPSVGLSDAYHIYEVIDSTGADIYPTLTKEQEYKITDALEEIRQKAIREAMEP